MKNIIIFSENQFKSLDIKTEKIIKIVDWKTFVCFGCQRDWHALVKREKGLDRGKEDYYAAGGFDGASEILSPNS